MGNPRGKGFPIATRNRAVIHLKAPSMATKSAPGPGRSVALALHFGISTYECSRESVSGEAVGARASGSGHRPSVAALPLEDAASGPARPVDRWRARRAP